MTVEVNAGVFQRAGLAFQYLGAFVDKKLSFEVQRDIGLFILERAKQLVPVRTGALRASGRLAQTPDRKGIEVRFGTSNVGYAMVVEFGRVSYAPFAPRPYIRPAVQAARKKWKNMAIGQLEVAKRSTLPKIIF